MSATTYDTHSFVKILKEKGFTEPQAEAIIQIAGQMRETGLQAASTKADLRELELKLQNQIKELELRLQTRIGGMIMALGGILVAIKYFG